MYRFKLIAVALAMLACDTGYSQDGQSVYYQKAVKLYQDAASKTKCPARAAYLRKMADWNQCMVDALAGRKSPCPPSPTDAPPPCDGDMIGGAGSGSSSAATKVDPVKELQAKQQQLQQEFNMATSASTSAFENAINSGKKTSGALVDATLAGSQYISDPKASLAYAGVGLAAAGIAALGERKQAKLQARQEELENIKNSLASSSYLFDFMSGNTDYHITSLKVEMKKNGRIKSVTRTDLYDIAVKLYKIVNSKDSITVFEAISFKNITSGKDSVILSRIVIPIRYIRNVQAYNGNYTNSFDLSDHAYKNYRYKQLDNSSIEYAFSMQGDYPLLPSGLTDVYIETSVGAVKVQKKFSNHLPYSINDNDFVGVYRYSSSSYLFVFDDYNDRIKDFVDYLNYVKN